ncbi:MAG TPA: dihydrofolate reductase family protein [Holophagaceae bacterium]|nr:dihydrofolate reductase family protein [Holophagaceae bacterium]
MPEPKVLLSLALSLDGFLADAEGGVGWLDGTMVPDMDFEGFMAQVDTVILGRATYDQALGMSESPLGRMRHVVLTHRPLEPRPGVETFSGDPAALIARLKAEAKGLLWLMGGGRSAQPFLDAGLVDELELNLVPLTLGRGLPLFQPDAKPLKLAFIEQQVYSNGVVRLKYRVE